MADGVGKNNVEQTRVGRIEPYFLRPVNFFAQEQEEGRGSEQIKIGELRIHPTACESFSDTGYYTFLPHF
jgi:hypothetical protein